MRILIVLLCGCGLTAAQPPEPVVVLPFQPIARHTIYPVGQFDGDGGIAFSDTITYALAPLFPTHITVTNEGPAYLATRACFEAGTVHWTQVLGKTGSAASLMLDAGTLELDLQREGTSVFQLAGQFEGCGSTWSMSHVLTVTVNAVTGVAVVACARIPVGAEVPAPGLSLLDADARPYTPANANRPAALTLDAPGGAQWLDAGTFIFGRGAVTVRADLPLSGPTVWRVLGPDELTDFDARIEYSSPFNKSSPWSAVDGGTLDLSWAEDHLRLGVVNADVCIPPPDSWFALNATGICEVTGSNEVTLRDAGTCQVDATLLGTSRTWSETVHAR